MPNSSNVVSEGLHSIRLGVVALFGIVVPGVWFWATVTLYLAYLFGAQSLSDVNTTARSLEAIFGPYLTWTILFLLVYVTGSVLRILPPDVPDWISHRWIRARDKDALDDAGRFPYQSLPKYLRDRGLRGLAALVPWDVGASGHRPVLGRRSKTFLHFIKMYIALHNPRLATHLARQEAFIRLLSGVFYAAVVSTFALVFGLFAQRGWNELAKMSLGIFGFNLLLILGILHAFHYQRLREVVMVLSAYFLIGPSEHSPYVELEEHDVDTHPHNSA